MKLQLNLRLFLLRVHEEAIFYRNKAFVCQCLHKLRWCRPTARAYWSWGHSWPGQPEKKIVKLLSYISVSGSDSSWISKIREIEHSTKKPHEIVVSSSQFQKIIGFINLLSGWNNQFQNCESEFSIFYLICLFAVF